MHILFVDDVLVCCFVAVAAASSEIDNEDKGGLLSESYQEVVRLDISIEIAVVVQNLKSVQNLQRDNDSRFEGKSSAAKFLQLL